MRIFDALKNLTLKQENIAVKELKTPWTDQITPDHVLQEYPRPQMVRDSYLNLNGLWQYAILEKTMDQILPEPIASGPASTAGISLESIPWEGNILVPFSPEAPLSGVRRQLLPGQTLCYEKKLSLHLQPGKRLLLHFGAVDQRCRVYVNGQQIGEHEGGYLPFSLDITDVIQEGENCLNLLCQDDSDTSFHTRGKQMLKRGGMFYTAQSGIWQTVWMEWVPALYIDSLRLTPDYDQGQIQISVNTTGPISERNVLYRAQITSKGRLIAGLSTEAPDFSLVIPDFIAWTPDNPYLYDLTLELCDPAAPDAVIDRVESYFAMRCVTVEKDGSGTARLCLNHVPYFQHGLLDQGYWPDGLLTAPCEEALIYDIQTMKDAGFNMLRKHCKLEPLRWYYHCDRLGMLVWQDITNGGSTYDMFHLCYRPTILPHVCNGPYDRVKGTGRTDPASHEEWYRECQTTMEHLYNCPSIVNWVIFNEGWGQFDTEKATAFAKALDSTRTFDQASGWFDHCGGDMKSVHNYFRKLVCPTTNTTAMDSTGSANLCGVRAAVISEYGGLALPVMGHITTDQIYGYKNLKSAKEFQTRFADIMKQIRALEADGLSAAVYTQVSDIEDEVNGILTYDRKVNKLSAQ